ncbi:hypothetical protein [Dietzia sp. ANT_WB102]|uniref:hypothetical protein n=1 Tax=Dietzia sp. ANT_WB102 TaxID=2597345 RepID=UPI0011ED0376|nr:hypothetical protein [Dietzia sp. ANT_WB102]KAA0918231.1 hypothetical protein FQ137_02350 [Dietzia sp. ANT_WB102]
MATEMLHTYMQDHHAGAAAGLDLFRRVAESHSDPHVRDAVGRIRDETVEDLKVLEELMTLAGTAPSLLKDLPAKASEKLVQFKPNRRFAERSPLSDLIELEALTLAVTGKKMGFRALLEIGDTRLPTPTLQNLVERAEHHARVLEELRVRCVYVLKEK